MVTASPVGYAWHSKQGLLGSRKDFQITGISKYLLSCDCVTGIILTVVNKTD